MDLRSHSCVILTSHISIWWTKCYYIAASASGMCSSAYSTYKVLSLRVWSLHNVILWNSSSNLTDWFLVSTFFPQSCQFWGPCNICIVATPSVHTCNHQSLYSVYCLVGMKRKRMGWFIVLSSWLISIIIIFNHILQLVML